MTNTLRALIDCILAVTLAHLLIARERSCHSPTDPLQSTSEFSPATTRSALSTSWRPFTSQNPPATDERSRSMNPERLASDAWSCQSTLSAREDRNGDLRRT